MAVIRYEIVQHDGGWAYKMQGVYSEPFSTREEAAKAATLAASEQQIPGETVAIQYEDEQGRWHDEIASGSDRPSTEVGEA